MPGLNEILQKLWNGLPGLLGIFVFLVTLGIYIAITAWENAARRDEMLRAERERARRQSGSAPPAAPEPAGIGADRFPKGS